MSVQDDRISSFVQLKKFHNHEEALQLLKKLASHVKPIMKKRNWRVTILQEFYPNDQRLLGLNIDRGKKICIRLRPHYDQTRFFDFNDLIGTMLHELSHIECAPHDAKFYKLLDLLHDEYDELLVKGHTGDWFFGNHYRLGQSNNVPLATAGLKSLETIEKKQQLERIMPKGGIRLGGTAHTNYNLPIRELTAMAIEQRLKDIVWCGGERSQNEIIINSSSSSNGITTTTITTNNFNDNNRSRAVRIPADKLPKVTTTKTNSETEKWSCPQCTFVNRPLVLQCEICLEERPNYGENILESDSGVIIIIDQEDNNNIDNNSFRKWGCPRCTFDNDLDNVMCIGCDYLRN